MGRRTGNVIVLFTQERFCVGPWWLERRAEENASTVRFREIVNTHDGECASSRWVYEDTYITELWHFPKKKTEAALAELRAAGHVVNSASSIRIDPRPAADPEDQPRLAVEGGIPYLLAAALRPAPA